MIVIQNQGVMATFAKAIRLAFSTPLNRYVWWPLIINCCLLACGSYFLLTFIAGVEFFSSESSSLMLQWLIVVANWSIKVLLYWLFFPMLMHAFALLATLILSPFNAVLAEQASHNFGQSHPDNNESFKQILWSSFQREWLKVTYYLPRVLLLFFLGFVPLLNMITPVLWFLFAAWMMAIQFLDYPADNQQIDFNSMLVRLQKKRWQVIKFGIVIAFLMLIPILNFVLIPVSVVAASYYWASHFSFEN